MNSKRGIRKKLSEDEIDEIVESQGGDDSLWEKPVHVVREELLHQDYESAPTTGRDGAGEQLR